MERQNIIITLTSDFGPGPYVGLMKGVILGLCPQAYLVDLEHGLAPQDVLAGALVLEQAIGVFPDGTVHLAVVDPGVGTGRRPLVVDGAGGAGWGRTTAFSLRCFWPIPRPRPMRSATSPCSASPCPPPFTAGHLRPGGGRPGRGPRPGKPGPRSERPGAPGLAPAPGKTARRWWGRCSWPIASAT